MSDSFPSVVELNVGGQLYTTALSTMTKFQESLLGQMFTGKAKTPMLRDTRGRYFIDRDGLLFRYVLDFLRNTKLVLPENFEEVCRLQQEAEFYQLPELINQIGNTDVGLNCLVNSTNALKTGNSNNGGGYVTLGYRGTFAFGRDGLADVQFRKLTRILVCGKVTLCREVFQDTLNESRDPDRGQADRYTSRYFLKHTFLEQAFDMLAKTNFKFVGCCSSGVSNIPGNPEWESEEARWQHYNEFVFYRSLE